MCAGGWLGERVCVRIWFECVGVGVVEHMCTCEMYIQLPAAIAKPSKVT